MSDRRAKRGARAGGSKRVVLDPVAVFEALGDAEVDYVLIGGLAVGAHGAGRATRDVDICPNPSESNLRRLADLLESIDAVSADEDEFGADELPPHDLEGLKAGGNFRLRTRIGALDVMQYVEPFGGETWSTLDKHAEDRQAFGQTVRVCGYENLLEMKQAAGRDLDRIDIENLKAARREL
jgi:hypothetical protein